MTTIDKVIAACPHQLMRCHKIKARNIDRALQSCIPHTALGGKRVRCSKNLMRFKIGTSFRLLYQTSENGPIPWALISRQRLERVLKPK